MQGPLGREQSECPAACSASRRDVKAERAAGSRRSLSAGMPSMGAQSGTANWFRPRLSLSLHATCASTCASANSLLKQHVAASHMPAELRLTLDGECTEAVNSPAVVLQRTPQLTIRATSTFQYLHYQFPRRKRPTSALPNNQPKSGPRQSLGQHPGSLAQHIS